MWCVLGTLGSFFTEALLSEASLSFRFLLSLPALPSARAAGEAATDSPAEMSLGPLSDREGFDDEHLLWWPRAKTDAAAAAFGAAAASVDARPGGAADETTRRTETGNMIAAQGADRAARREVGEGGRLSRCGCVAAVRFGCCCCGCSGVLHASNPDLAARRLKAGRLLPGR